MRPELRGRELRGRDTNWELRGRDTNCINSHARRAPPQPARKPGTATGFLRFAAENGSGPRFASPRPLLKRGDAPPSRRLRTRHHP
jgi:hypothetical protein